MFFDFTNSGYASAIMPGVAQSTATCAEYSRFTSSTESISLASGKILNFSGTGDEQTISATFPDFISAALSARAEPIVSPSGRV